MSKALLILPEMPDECIKCPACAGHGVMAVCRASGKYVNTCVCGRPDFCPLRPIEEVNVNEIHK